MKKVVIIAEAGVNHNAVPNLVVTKKGTMAEYQIQNLGIKESQLEMTKKIHLPLSDFKILSQYAERKNIKFASTPFDLVSIDTLKELNMDFFKIPSGEITNYPYLVKVAKMGLPIIMSTGMATIAEIKDAIKVLTDNGVYKDKITVLHCNTEYPTPMEDVNLKAMLHIQQELGVAVGYSDHTLGIEVPIAAVALGATVIEKHFTLDKTLPGPEPDELKAMVNAIRNIEKAIGGSGLKEVSKSEEKNKAIARRSIVASKNIKKGELLTEENLIVKRPGTGLSPMLWDEVIGTKAIRDFEEDDLITI